MVISPGTRSADSGPRGSRRLVAASGGALSFVLCALQLSGCDRQNPSDSFRVETFDGISHSVAEDRPESGAMALEMLWQAPPPEEIAEGSAWANPTQLTADDRGVAVLDPQLSQVHLFGRDGQRQTSLGRQGEGPGELTSPSQLALHGDTVLVNDTHRSGLQLFSRSGGYIGSFAGVDGISFGFHYLDGIGVLRSSVVPVAGQVTPQWTYFGLDGERREAAQPGDHPLQPHVREGGSGCWRRRSAGTRMLEVDCTFPLIRVVNLDGEVLREHRIDREPELSSPEALEAMAETVRSSMGQMGAPSAMVQGMVDQQLERNRWAPLIRLAAGTPSGERIVIWEQLSSDLGGGEATLHVLSGEGRYLMRQEMGLGLQGLAVTEDRIYVLASDPETDLKTLRSYRMP